MALTRIKLDNFTVFEDLDLELSPGINVFVGANGTGKTHLMKVCYAASDISTTGSPFATKLVEVFLPSRRFLGRLVKRDRRGKGSEPASIRIYRDEMELGISFSRYSRGGRATRTRGTISWAKSPIESVYIPAKEILANGPGFRSLNARREVHFEGVYSDILDRAYLPALRDHPDASMRRLSAKLRKSVGGRVTIKNEEFYLGTGGGTFEFTLVSEGLRRLALLSLLIQNGALRKGSLLFWDEPEANLSPKLFGELLDVLLELQRNAVQVFLATHDYVILKELDLRKEGGDEVAFHSLHRSSEGRIVCDTTDNYLDIHPNAIAEAFSDIFDREIERSMKAIAR